MSTRTYNQTITENLIAVSCFNCGVQFGLAESYYNRALAHHDKWWYCPNGHAQHFIGKTEAQKLREQLERQKRYTESARALETATRDQLQATERSRRAIRGALTKTKRRIANGVCPCCHRTFKQLAEHMEKQHPGYELEQVG